MVSGLSNPLLLKRVRDILRIDRIFESSLEDYRRDAWLTEFNYTVNFNDHYIFDITFEQSGVGAYPDTHYRHFALDLKQGKVIRAAEVFKHDKLVSLAELIDRKLRAELKEIEEGPNFADQNAEDKDSLRETLTSMKFEVCGK
jgi:hypothetical protein